MLDLKFLRENPDIVKENIRKKFQDHKIPMVDEVIELDVESRKTKQEADSLRANRKAVSKQIGGLMAQGKKDEAEALKVQVTKDAERLAAELKNGQKDAIEEDAREETVEMPSDKKKDESNQKEYSGPSVVSYSLEGRKASHLNIPAYRCYGEGDVTVIITVDNSGRVVNAKVLDAVSSEDQCLRNFAVRAARLSRFSASQTAPARQSGEILYRFIAQ